MKVTLAYPYTDEAGTTHDPDKTIDLPDETANMLISEGRARTADSTRAKKEA